MNDSIVDGPGRKILVVAVLADSLVNFRWNLLESLVKQGHTVVTAAARDDAHDGITGKDVSARLATLGIRHRPVPMQRTGNNPLADLATLRHLIQVCREEQPDIVFAYTAKAVVYGTLAAWLCRVPRRVSMLTGLPFGLVDDGRRTLAHTLARSLFRIAFRVSHALVFHNPDDLASLRQAGLLPDRLSLQVVNGSGVDLEHFQLAGLPGGPTTFLMIARLMREKGVVEYLDAARLAKRRHPTARFLLVGPLDPRTGQVQERDVRAWEQEGVGEWLGSVTDVRIPIGRSHVFVLPSYHEGTPRTVLEAMAMGRPIITTDAPGCRQTVEAGRNGCLVPVGDREALADAIVRFLEVPADIPAMGATSRRLAEERYDVRKVSLATIQAILGPC